MKFSRFNLQEKIQRCVCLNSKGKPPCSLGMSLLTSVEDNNEFLIRVFSVSNWSVLTEFNKH